MTDTPPFIIKPRGVVFWVYQGSLIISAGSYPKDREVIVVNPTAENVQAAIDYVEAWNR